ncbi:hypothetical protein L1887_15232 [Cichorium endivia]|nr:hypothetical protein L1887_15232 [Cichorium endivia]
MVQEATYDFLLSQMEPLGSNEKEMDFKIQHPYFIPPRDIVFVEVDKDDARFASTSEILGVVMVVGAQASSCEELASTMTDAESSVLKGLQQCIDIVIAEVDRSLSTEQKPLDYRSADNSIIADHRHTVACTSYGTFATGGCNGIVNVCDGNNKNRLCQYSKYSTSIAALSFSRDGRLLVVASCYTFEEGDKPHEPDAIFVRSMNEVEVKPKPK